jgi:hypothetical protein
MHSCSGSDASDLYTFGADGSYSTIYNPYGPSGDSYFGVGTTQGDQVFVSSYEAGYSDWLAYNP